MGLDGTCSSVTERSRRGGIGGVLAPEDGGFEGGDAAEEGGDGGLGLLVKVLVGLRRVMWGLVVVVVEGLVRWGEVGVRWRVVVVVEGRGWGVEMWVWWWRRRRGVAGGVVVAIAGGGGGGWRLAVVGVVVGGHGKGILGGE